MEEHGISKPYRRTVRPFMHDAYPYKPEYVLHSRFAEEPEMYVRAFRLLQKDLEHLFEYIEPSDDNLKCYSFRVYELLLRACIEVEANCKAILRENGYPQGKWWTMADYYKIDSSHFLSSFEVALPHWHGEKGIRRPFQPWASGERLGWYRAYNEAKHYRREGFKTATFEHWRPFRRSLPNLASHGTLRLQLVRTAKGGRSISKLPLYH